MRFIVLIIALLISAPAVSQETHVPNMEGRAEEMAIRTTGLPVPRFVSLKGEKAFVRTGPGLRYPIEWVFEKEDLPVEIIQEFDTWRKVRGPQGEEGWIHQTLVSGQRTVLVTGKEMIELRKEPAPEAKLVAKAEPGVIAHLLRCGAAYCELQSDNYRGWTSRKSLWGIYADEQIK